MAIIEKGNKRYSYIEAGIRRKLSARAMQRSMRGTPFATRWQDILDTKRHIEEKRRRAERFKFIRKDRRPEIESFEVGYRNQTKNYLYEGRFRGWNEKLQEWQTRGFKHGADTRETIGHVERWVEARMTSDYFVNVHATTERGWRVG